MGKASSNKKVARAAAAGSSSARSATSGGLRTIVTAAAVVLAVGLGIFLIASSASENKAASSDRPRGGDHWHAALGYDTCGTFQPNSNNNNAHIGIHTHADGLVHVEPQNSADMGASANLGRFISGQKNVYDMVLEKDKFNVPWSTDTKKEFKNGDKCPGSDVPGKVFIKLWDPGEGKTPKDSDGTIFEGDPHSIRIKNFARITVAFLPEDTDPATIPLPPSQDNLLDPLANEGLPPGTIPITSTTSTLTQQTEIDLGSNPGSVADLGGSTGDSSAG